MLMLAGLALIGVCVRAAVVDLITAMALARWDLKGIATFVWVWIWNGLCW